MKINLTPRNQSCACEVRRSKVAPPLVKHGAIQETHSPLCNALDIFLSVLVRSNLALDLKMRHQCINENTHRIILSREHSVGGANFDLVKVCAPTGVSQ